MPVTHHFDALPPVVADAHEMVRSPARIDIVKWLLRNPDSLVSEIVMAIGSQRITTRQHLVALERVGVVEANLPEGERQRQRVRYSVDRARATALLHALTDHLIGA